jgi:GDP-L-fucose synthase
MNKDSRIFVAGHRGLVGGAIMRRLVEGGYSNIVVRTRSELDLRDQSAVEAFFATERPEYVFLAAAKVGGIGANSEFPADFIYENMMIGFNVVDAARRCGSKKLLNLGSSCIYPKMAPQPLKEEYFLTGALEPTNDAYALAKISTIKLCESCNRQYGTDFISIMPTNLYGRGDNYDLAGSHVLPALIRRFHEAKVEGTDSVRLWGDGSPFREFLYADDLADAAVFLMERKTAKEIGVFVNVGTGWDLTIKELAEKVRSIVYADALNRACSIEWNVEKPNGTPRKLLDVSRLAELGWKASTGLEEGLHLAYQDFILSESRRGK